MRILALTLATTTMIITFKRRDYTEDREEEEIMHELSLELLE